MQAGWLLIIWEEFIPVRGFSDCNVSMLLSLVSRALGFVSNLKDFALIGAEKLALAEGVDRITF